MPVSLAVQSYSAGVDPQLPLDTVDVHSEVESGTWQTYYSLLPQSCRTGVGRANARPENRAVANLLRRAAAGLPPALRWPNLAYDNVRCRAQGELRGEDPSVW
jgi:hypothetical protein